MMEKPLVGILMGSDSDLKVMRKAAEVLGEMGIPCEMDISSCGAGMAAHLAGVVASHTTLPVIGVPLASGALNGVDALYSTVQMPPGIPVATVAVDGAKNAAYLACSIISIKRPELAERLEAFRAKTRNELTAKSAALQSELGGPGAA